MATVLVREECEVFDRAIEDGNVELQERARDVLGYYPRIEAARIDARDKELAAAIRGLGIKPFTTASVERYKAKKIGVGVSEDVVIPIFIFGGLAAIVLAISTLIWVCGEDRALIVMQISGAIAAGCTALLTAIFRFFYVDTMRQWVHHEVCSYSDPIPEFALQTALSVKDSCPSARIYIEEFQVSRIARDPFLFVTSGDGGKRFYLEVWDERGFKVQREV